MLDLSPGALIYFQGPIRSGALIWTETLNLFLKCHAWYKIVFNLSQQKL